MHLRSGLREYSWTLCTVLYRHRFWAKSPLVLSSVRSYLIRLSVLTTGSAHTIFPFVAVLEVPVIGPASKTLLRFMVHASTLGKRDTFSPCLDRSSSSTRSQETASNPQLSFQMTMFHPAQMNDYGMAVPSVGIDPPWTSLMRECAFGECDIAHPGLAVPEYRAAGRRDLPS